MDTVCHYPSSVLTGNACVPRNTQLQILLICLYIPSLWCFYLFCLWYIMEKNKPKKIRLYLFIFLFVCLWPFIVCASFFIPILSPAIVFQYSCFYDKQISHVSKTAWLLRSIVCSIFQVVLDYEWIMIKSSYWMNICKPNWAEAYLFEILLPEIYIIFESRTFITVSLFACQLSSTGTALD